MQVFFYFQDFFCSLTWPPANPVQGLEELPKKRIHPVRMLCIGELPWLRRPDGKFPLCAVQGVTLKQAHPRHVFTGHMTFVGIFMCDGFRRFYPHTCVPNSEPRLLLKGSQSPPSEGVSTAASPSLEITEDPPLGVGGGHAIRAS